MPCMSDLSLSPELTDLVLAYLGSPKKSPSIRYLNQLIQAYIQHVPWESITRLIKRHTTSKTSDCPRWPVEFWKDARFYGTGGTCFECNLAFFSLLTTLGFQGYLTINDMQENRACHTASVIWLSRQKYLVDVAIPLQCALPVHNEGLTRRSTRFHNYTIRPIGGFVFEVERSHHPKRNIFTLLDTPIPLDGYRAAVERDYDENGLFLDRVIIVKVIGDRLWRFSSMDKPYKLEGFDKTTRQEITVSLEKLAPTLAGHFGLQEDKINAALSYFQLG